MKAKDIVVGRTYTAKVSGKVVPVKVLSMDDGGRIRWECENTLTKRRIVVKSPQRFRAEVRTEIAEPPATIFGRQWAEAKSQHSGMLLLFRVGDFYQAFGNDAYTLATVCGLTLRNRDGWPMAEFPHHHHLEVYLRKLLTAGHRVALCEQVNEVPVRKPIERIVLPNP